MSQTAISSQQLKQNNYAVVAGDLTITLTASDATNGNSLVATGSEILIVQNTDTASHTFTVSSVPDGLGRSDASLTAYSVAASSFAAIQLSQLSGWIQTNGNINLTSSSALLKFAILRKN